MLTNDKRISAHLLARFDAVLSRVMRVYAAPCGIFISSLFIALVVGTDSDWTKHITITR